MVYSKRTQQTLLKSIKKIIIIIACHILLKIIFVIFIIKQK